MMGNIMFNKIKSSPTRVADDNTVNVFISNTPVHRIIELSQILMGENDGDSYIALAYALQELEIDNGNIIPKNWRVEDLDEIDINLTTEFLSLLNSLRTEIEKTCKHRVYFISDITNLNSDWSNILIKIYPIG